MIRCPGCHRACPEKDLVCHHCGTALEKAQPTFWRWHDWLQGRYALWCIPATLFVFGFHLLCHPLMMPYRGDRVESRMATFHVLMGLSCGVAVGFLRGDKKRLFYTGLGLLGGAVSWALDASYMADHLMLQAVWYASNWVQGGATPRSTFISYGLLQGLRYLGPVFFLSLAAAWTARPPIRLRIALFSLLALALRFPVKGFAVAPGLLQFYPVQSLLYILSLFVLFYGLGTVDDHSIK